MDMKRRKKYIVIGAAMAVAGVSCMAGASAHNTSMNSYNAKYSLESSINEASATDVAVDTENTDIVKLLTDSITMDEKNADKEETVYVFSGATGDVNKIIVNEHLINKDGASEIVDATNLNDIKNIKGYEEFKQEGDKISWNADGKDIYYQGTSENTLPVNVSVSYFLDGKQMKPEELVGKSGKVTIRYDYINNATVRKQIDGKEEDIKVPFVAVTGMMLDSKFENIEVTNGKAVQEGDSNIVVGYAMPGLTDSLGLTEDKVKIPEYFEVSADVTDFAMEMTVTLVANGSGLKVGGELDLEELDTLIESISGAGDALAEGSTQVSSGANTISEKLGELSTGVKALDTGIDTLASSVTELVTAIGTINTSAQSINTGIASLDTALNTPFTDEEKQALATTATTTVNNSFAEGTETYNTIYNSATASFEGTITNDATIEAIYQGLYANLYDTLYQAAAAQTMATYKVPALNEEMQAAVKTQVETKLRELATGIAQGIATQGKDAVGKNVVEACKQSATQSAVSSVIAGAEGTKTQIAGKIEAVQENGYSLVTGANALAAGTNTLADSMPALSTGMTSLTTGSEELVTGAGQLATGAGELATGAEKLKEGIETLNNDVISSIVEAYDGNVKEFSDRMAAITEASTEYDTYTLVGEGKEATTKFIIKVDGIYNE